MILPDDNRFPTGGSEVDQEILDDLSYIVFAYINDGMEDIGLFANAPVDEFGGIRKQLRQQPAARCALDQPPSGCFGTLLLLRRFFGDSVDLASFSATSSSILLRNSRWNREGFDV
jgi:hypothetical protein